ncbi:hypothetical protein [Gemmatimonas phototrophica]|uniref:Uncharacterized protein n=1 Tax=Gemmatimonas phototrophica TaxID=1379270 RepID=A0A143BLM3_9BACT|nr:hypothetical protein [Gemmatimonas phototrophica]AMW05410.1 hypothetical protein GEMMAAP_12540 [Gemmatimonas phototrophica]
MPPVRVLVVAGLAVAGALSAATAATVYTATLPTRDAHERGQDALWASGWKLSPQALVSRAAQRDLPASERLATLEYLVAGACLEPREMLFGASAYRWTQLHAAAAVLRDVPQQAHALALARRSLQQFSAGPGKGAVRGDDKNFGEHVVQLVLPDILLERVQRCRALRLP